MKRELRCHPGIGPTVSGTALVADDNFSARYDLDRIAGVFSRPQHKLVGQPYVDRILVLKGLYHFSEPNRFDVVVFKNPTNPNGDDGNYIKRLIGLPGDVVQVTGGGLHVNGEPVGRELIGAQQSESGADMAFLYDETLPNGVMHTIRELSDEVCHQHRRLARAQRRREGGG